MFPEFLPAFFLAFSGLAFGYLLWHRDSRLDDAARQKLLRQNSEMNQTLQMAQASYNTLDERFTRQRAQLSVLQQLCDDWSASRDQADKERVELDVQITERTRRIEELTKELSLAREQAIKLEDNVHALTQQQLEKVSSIESHWHQKTSQIENALVQHKSDVSALTGDRDRQLKKLHKAESRIAELESELRTKNHSLESAKDLEEGQATLQSELDHTKALLNKSEGQCAAERSEKDSLREQLKSAKQQSDYLQGQVEALQVKESELETHKQKAESLVLSLSNANGQLEKVVTQRDSALDTCNAIETTAKGLQTRLENQEASIHRLRKSQDDALENLKHELKIRSEIEAKYDERLNQLRTKLETQKTKYEKQLAEFHSVKHQQKQDFDTEVEMLHEVAEQEVLELKKQLEKAEATIKTVNAGREQDRLKLTEFADIAMQLTQRETQINELSVALQSNTSDYQQQIVKLEAQREQLTSDLEVARNQLQSQLKQDSETIGLLQGERNELRDEVERLHEKVAELQQAVVDQERSHQSAAADSEELKRTVERLKQQEKELHRKDNALKHLQAESNELARLRDAHAASLRRQAELQARLDSMMVDHLSDQNLRQRIANQEETIEKLRRERDAMAQSTEPDPAVISFTQAIQQRNESAYDPAYGGRVRHDSARGVVFTEAPESRDDLKRISGIATVLETRLNEFGIYTFKQIMDWKPEEIEEFSRLLTFRDRIERDDWQGQARFFYNQKSQDNQVA